MKKTKLSKRSNRLTGQGMFQIKAKAKSLGLLHFEMGDSCFNAPRKVKRACIKAIKENRTNYTDPLGLPELRQAVADRFKVEVENVAIVPANFGIFASLSVLCNKGDKIDYPVPGFPTYRAVSSYLGLKRSKKAKIHIWNSPNNPTGKILANKTNDFVIFDAAYMGMDYLKGKNVMKLGGNSILLCSFSKTHSMSGFRLGYMISTKEIIEKVGLLIETTYSCLPEFIQLAGIEALKISRYKMKELKKRRNLMFRILHGKYACDLPEGGIYFWCKCQDGDKEFDRLLKKGIVVCPGSVFGEKGYIRFCFARSIKEIEKLGELL